MKNKIVMLISCLSLGVAFAGCVEEDGEAKDCPPGQKCDTPSGKAPAEIQCEERRQEVLNDSQPTFTATAIRWAASDVAGVNTVGNDDRGQEYTEYFVVVGEIPADDTGTVGPGTAYGMNRDGGGTTELSVELSEDQSFWLEDHPDEVVGQCVFTSWHADIQEPLPSCAEPDNPEAECADVMGVKFNAENLRMKVSFNSNVAASALVRDCLQGTIPQPDPNDLEDPLYSDFYRGCMLTAELYGTQWRRSDPSVCAAAIRLKECGCSLPEGADVPTSLVPTQPQLDDEGNEVLTLRGFPLGTWSGPSDLPVGCTYGNTGDESQTLVLCDLTANDLLVSAADPKDKCRTKYGDNVVVHVPIPEGVITCEPPAEGVNVEACGDMPWVVNN